MRAPAAQDDGDGEDGAGTGHEVEVTALTDHGTAEAVVPAGSIFVVPQGLWHRQHARRG